MRDGVGVMVAVLDTEVTLGVKVKEAVGINVDVELGVDVEEGV